MSSEYYEYIVYLRFRSIEMLIAIMEKSDFILNPLPFEKSSNR